MTSYSSIKIFSRISVYISQIFTEKLLPPAVIKNFPSLDAAISVISPGWAIKPIVELGLPSKGSLINPTIFSFVE